MQYEMLSYCRDTIKRVGSKIVQVQMVECSTCQKGRQIDDSFSEKYRVAELHDIVLLCSTILKKHKQYISKIKKCRIREKYYDTQSVVDQIQCEKKKGRVLNTFQLVCLIKTILKYKQQRQYILEQVMLQNKTNLGFLT